MADYYPLLVKALETQGGASPEAREAIYGRARAALAAQLGLIQPPLTGPEIDRERRSLDDAIARSEALFEAGEGADGPDRGRADLRPRVMAAGAGALRRTESRRSPAVVAILLGAVAAPVAFLAWSWRGQPRAPLPVAQTTPVVPTAPVAAPSKLDERLGAVRSPSGGAAAPPARAPVADPSTVGPAASGSVGNPSPADPVALAVAQRALLVEENPGDAAGTRTVAGRAVWRLDSVPGGPGMPLETVVRLTVDLSDAGLTLALTLRRNTDSALPASHTMELVFTPSGEAGRAVREIGLPLLRLDEGSRGLALAGLRVAVKENVFLVGLSDTRSDVDRNRELLLNRTWIELPVQFASGARALLLVEKGVAGERIMADAFRTWDGPR